MLRGQEVVLSSDPSIVSFEDGKITALKEGTATISVQSKDKTVSASCRVVVKSKEVQSIKLNPSKIKLYLSSEDTQIKAIKTILSPEGAKDKKLTWSSSNTKVAKINQNGLVDGVGLGKATITVKTSNGKTATAEVEVLPWPVTEVKLNAESITLHHGGKKEMKVEVLPHDAYDKKTTWSSSNTKVATVDKDGNIKGVGIGEATITVKSSNDKTDFVKVKVVSVPAQSIKLNKSSVEITRNSTTKVGVTISPSNTTNKSVSWSSKNTKVASVDKSGNIRGLQAGSATITVKTSNGKQASVKVTVTESGSCNISSISARNVTVSYKINCTGTSYVSDTQYKVGNGSYISRGKGWGSVTSKSGSIVFKSSNAKKTITLRVYYNGKSKSVTKSVKLGNPYCKSGYTYNSSSKKCERKVSISTRVSCSSGKYNKSNNKCVTTSYTCPKGGTKSTSYATVYCMNKKKTSVFKQKLNNGMWGYKASSKQTTSSPNTTYYCKEGRKVGSGRSSYCLLSYNP